MHVTRRCLISGPTRMIDSITQKKSNLLEIKTTVIIYECFVFIYYVRNSKRLKFWALASQWLHAHRVQPPKINWNGTASLTVMNQYVDFYQKADWSWIVRIGDLYNTRGEFKSKKEPLCSTLSPFEHYLLFSSSVLSLLKKSNPDWFQFTYWRKKNQFSKSSIEVIIWKFCFLVWWYTNSAKEIFLG